MSKKKTLVPSSPYETITQTKQTNRTKKKGLRLLTKMGWKGEGHGLGRQQQGIASPIEVGETRERAGLGLRVNYYEQYVEEMAAGIDPSDTVAGSRDG